MLQIIGIVAIAWLAISALVVAIAVAAGRADRGQQQVAVSTATRTQLRGPQISRTKTRHARAAARTASDHRMRPGMRAAIR
ncbi:hypothetical protein VSS74_08545 [Conexibacter stalactiti]|uniref:Secreted protein n=1 Tax=Conexibacter stalactiti TaxID=1940611 RepID=A0ABU4HNV2_9ACTN|nr:hypothetical protein [Conexibacter stalactiti]MDW5594382.1 hypothetical protein [Conexibacter stalactiti]MEC5035024.1 hypothetical protein [Conexibacter stalactiti]